MVVYVVYKEKSYLGRIVSHLYFHILKLYKNLQYSLCHSDYPSLLEDHLQQNYPCHPLYYQDHNQSHQMKSQTFFFFFISFAYFYEIYWCYIYNSCMFNSIFVIIMKVRKVSISDSFCFFNTKFNDFIQSLSALE